MVEALRLHRRRPHLPHVHVERHPREDALAVVTIVLGVVAAVTAFFPALHVIGAISGASGVAVGLTSQLLSETCAEREVTVLGIGMSAVGWAFAMLHGGFTG